MKKALVIDDNMMFRDSLEVMLQEIGFEVSAFEGPDKVTDEEGPFEIIMCDLMMPADLNDDELDEEDHFEEDQSVMVGVHAISELSKKYPQATVIAMSGFVEPQVLSAMSTFGAKVTLKKPFDLEDLERAISRAEAQRNTARA